MRISSLAQSDFTAYLNEHDQKTLLRFITCGSVDDGKSTLIGRMLYESQLIYEDQLAALEADSKKFGTVSDAMDFALLVDGLAAEREQGITIDVAYRFFATDKRKFIVADTPGHEQYTRNMATGASTAQVAIVLVDARKGLVTQTRRHSFIVSMLGVKHIILAINKMDLLDYDQAVFEKIRSDYLTFADSIDIKNVHAIPVSALKGDNITSRSGNMPWYDGVSLITYLEDVQLESSGDSRAFRMPVQWVNRPHQDFRGFAGRISSGSIKPGDAIRVLPGNQQTTVARLVTYDGDLQEACAGQSVTITLHDDVAISRGDMLSSVEDACDIADQFSVRLLWMNEVAMVSGRQYLFKSNTVSVLCTPGKPKYRIDPNTLEHLGADEFCLNDMGDCDLFLERPIAFESYETNRETGGFILIDRMSHATVGAGFIQAALRASSQVPEQTLLVDREQRVAIKGHKPMVLWFTGLSGAGKSTIANLVERELNLLGKHSMLLDGDCIRHALNRDLDFSASGRAENIRRIAEVAKLMTDAGLITLVSFISPFRAEREMARKRIGTEQFLEIYCDVPLEVVEARDVKGLYKKAREGIIQNFTGIGSPYEAPEQPDLHLHTDDGNPYASVDKIMAMLVERGVIYSSCVTLAPSSSRAPTSS